MFDTLARTLGTALEIWNSKEKTKYVDRLVSIKTSYYREFNKPDSARSDAVLDNLRIELCILADAFSAAARAPGAAAQ